MKKLLTLLTLAATTIVCAGGISGQVADAVTGEPIANALVVAKSENGDAGRAQTNERGLYRIEGLEPGNYHVGAMARGYSEARYPGPVPVRGREITEGINFRLRKDRPELGAIAGKVTDRRAGEPVKGAVIVAIGGNGRQKSRSDGRGNYILKGHKPGD
jgi:protocatechuate 3,4-dioxygenase beta subunit